MSAIHVMMGIIAVVLILLVTLLVSNPKVE